jgi:hypothetical protein
MQNLASQNFPTQKRNLEHISNKVKKHCFSRLYLGFQKWTFLGHL